MAFEEAEGSTIVTPFGSTRYGIDDEWTSKFSIIFGMIYTTTMPFFERTAIADRDDVFWGDFLKRCSEL